MFWKSVYTLSDIFFPIFLSKTHASLFLPARRASLFEAKYNMQIQNAITNVVTPFTIETDRIYRRIQHVSGAVSKESDHAVQKLIQIYVQIIQPRAYFTVVCK